MPRPAPDLVLGTVQIGLPYGVANRTGQPSEAEAVALLRRAAAQGVRWFDTARAYGDSERRIGLALAGMGDAVAVVTKLDPLARIDATSAPEIAADAARKSLAQSFAALGRDRVDGLLLHRAAHRTAWNGAVWDVLRRARDEGRAARIGVSVQAPREALAALSDAEMTHIQLPFNVLDRRWLEAGVVDALRGRPDILVHTRSALLQGLLCGLPDVRWPAAGERIKEAVDAALHALAERHGRRDPVDLSLAYVRGQDWIDGVVLGMESDAQLADNLASWARPPLAPEASAELSGAMPRCGDDVLDPARWRG